MPIQATCQACESSFRVRDEMAGKLGKCPRCGQVFRVPAAQAEPATRALPPDLVASGAVTLDSPSSGVAAKSGTTRTSGSSGRIAVTPAVEPALGPDLGISPPPTQRLARGRVRPRPAAGALWVWVLIVGVVLGGGAFGAYSVFFNDPRQVAQQPSQPREPRGPKLNRTPLLNPSTTQAAPVAPRPQEGAPLEDIVEYVKHAIVKIDIYDEFNNRGGLGSGFVIDKSGLVATNYHVVGAGIKADVLFNDGTRYGVEGYVALKPECDLAIVQLNGVPPNIAALELRTEDDPRTASKVIAIGHPHGYEFTVTDGIVSAVVDTPSLPQEAQQFLKGLLKQDKTDNRWIQHNAQIAQGNSGGPLLNPRGQVVGVNTWQNRDIGANFAIHAKHLKEALANRFPKVEALAQHRKREDAPAVIQSGRPEVTPKDFVAQFEAAAKTRWTPKSAEEYNLLKTMARTWTRAQFLLSLPPGRVPENYDGERNDWQQELAKAQQALVGISWNAETQIKPINHFALSAGLSIDQGVFVFATVKRTVPVGNSRWMQLVVEGGPAPLEFLLPLLKDDLAAPDGAKCLIVGVGSPPVNVVEGETQKQVPTVLCFTLLKLP